jgi:multimeric flavodoxin WrbA
MSGLMKDFFDRLTHLTAEPHKELGKSFKGKSLSVICAGSDPQPPLGFEQPFLLTAQYFGIIFKGVNYKAFTE